jgi:CBS domain-containing protein
MTTVKHVMAREPVVVHVDQSLVEAAARMRDARIGVLFAVDGDELVGVITDRDVAIRGVAEGLDPAATAVIDVMTRHVVYCHADSSLDDVGGLMARQQVRRLAVVDDDRELVGVLSIGDLARAGGRSATTLPQTMSGICERTPMAKTPAREDPTGGRWRGSPLGTLHVYARRPCIRRRRAFDPG